ncbi:MAG: hypothetical protein ACTS1Z_03960 [Parasphingopyxis sp.]|uniref:hypothetical protein n=1 Tax=Parasphingopyxis sp. TaxID=1920299 RepID=UPI003FA01CE9
MIRRAAICAMPLLLIACAGPEGEPPSLATRPIEGILDEPTRAIAPVPSATDATLAAEIERLVSQARAGDSDFDAAYPSARQAVDMAAGRPAESEAWIEAQLAVSALDSARAETTIALSALDTILAEQMMRGEPVEIDRLVEARDRVATLYAAQNARYGALNGRLRTR